MHSVATVADMPMAIVTFGYPRTDRVTAGAAVFQGRLPPEKGRLLFDHCVKYNAVGRKMVLPRR